MKKPPSSHVPTSDSPLPAWNHYEITREADLAIQEQLPDKQTRKEYLIGLEVEYFVPVDKETNEISYSMPFGKTQIESERPNPRTSKSALSDEFLNEIYQRVNKYVMENVQAPISVNSVKMLVRTTKVLRIIQKPCLTIGSTYQGLPVTCSSRCGNGARRFCNRTNTKWVCTHAACT
jgi:hypothetical protein